MVGDGLALLVGQRPDRPPQIVVSRARDAEAYFYSRVFGYELADPVELVEMR